MAKYKVIPIPIYRMDLRVFIGSLEEFKSFMEDKSKKNHVYDYIVNDVGENLNKLKSYEASTFWNRQARILIVYLPSLSTRPHSLNNIVHELSHATFHILDDVDIRIDANNDEPFAYLQGWLMQEVFEKNGYEEV